MTRKKVLKKNGVFYHKVNNGLLPDMGVTRTCLSCGTHLEDGICGKCAKTPNF